MPMPGHQTQLSVAGETYSYRRVMFSTRCDHYRYFPASQEIFKHNHENQQWDKIADVATFTDKRTGKMIRGSFNHDAGYPSPSSTDAGQSGSTPGDAGASPTFPESDEMLQGDLTVDGAAFKAIRVAVEDFKPRNRKPPAEKMQACFDDEAAYDFQVQRRGDLFFIRVTTLSERCDPVGVYTDGGVRYVISVDGRILRKLYEGQR